MLEPTRSPLEERERRAGAGPPRYAAPVILSSLLYLKRDGHTLMLHKSHGEQRGKWNGLGGKFEPGETPEACARREALARELTEHGPDPQDLESPYGHGEQPDATPAAESSDSGPTIGDYFEGLLGWDSENPE